MTPFRTGGGAAGANYAGRGLNGVTAPTSVTYIFIPADITRALEERILQLEGSNRVPSDATHIVPLLLGSNCAFQSLTENEVVLFFPTCGESREDQVPLFFFKRTTNRSQEGNSRAKALLDVFSRKLSKKQNTFYGDVCVFWRRSVDAARYTIKLDSYTLEEIRMHLGKWHPQLRRQQQQTKSSGCWSVDGSQPPLHAGETPELGCQQSGGSADTAWMEARQKVEGSTSSTNSEAYAQRRGYNAAQLATSIKVGAAKNEDIKRDITSVTVEEESSIQTRVNAAGRHTTSSGRSTSGGSSSTTSAAETTPEKNLQPAFPASSHAASDCRRLSDCSFPLHGNLPAMDPGGGSTSDAASVEGRTAATAAAAAAAAALDATTSCLGQQSPRGAATTTTAASVCASPTITSPGLAAAAAVLAWFADVQIQALPVLSLALAELRHEQEKLRYVRAETDAERLLLAKSAFSEIAGSVTCDYPPPLLCPEGLRAPGLQPDGDGGALGLEQKNEMLSSELRSTKIELESLNSRLKNAMTHIERLSKEIVLLRGQQQKKIMEQQSELETSEIAEPGGWLISAILNGVECEYSGRGENLIVAAGDEPKIKSIREKI